MIVSRRDAIVFLDKDGTLIRNVPYNVDPLRIELVEGAAEALVMLGQARVDVAVVANQPGVALGRFAEDALEAVGERIAELVAPFGIRLRGFFYCPHHPQGTVPRYAVDCNCRKPRCGMLMKASVELDVDLTRSWMVGDILDDVEAGHRAGCHTALLDNGGETEWGPDPFRRPDVVVKDLPAAVRAVLSWPRSAGRPAVTAPNAARHDGPSTAGLGNRPPPSLPRENVFMPPPAD